MRIPCLTPGLTALSTVTPAGSWRTGPVKERPVTSRSNCSAIINQYSSDPILHTNPIEAMTDVEEQSGDKGEHGEEAPQQHKVAGVTIDDAMLPLILVFVASIILLISTGAIYDWNFSGAYRGYLISISSVGIGLSAIALLMTKFASGAYEKIGKPLNMFIFLYCFVGACFLTFDEPFKTTGNGYFSAWAVVVGSAMSLGLTATAFKSSVRGLGAIMGLLAASIIVIIASIPPLKDGVSRNESIYALSLACFTAFFLAVVMFLDKKNGDKSLPPMVMFGFLAFLALCWIVQAGFCTFRGPFLTTGNGYFGSWAAAAACTFAAMAARKSD